MEIKHRYYPHPVLTYYGSDFKNVVFTSDVELKAADKEVVFEFNLFTDSETLKRLLENGSAAYCAHIECPGTYYRKLITSGSDGKFEYKIPTTRIEGLVQVCSFISATRDIATYQGDDFNDDYTDTIFEVKKGAVLAVAEQRNHRIEHSDDELARVPSIFMILPHNDPEAKEMAVDLNEQRILLYLPVEDFHRYKNVMGDTFQQPIFHSALILPALTYVLTELKQRENELYLFEDRRWYRSLNNKLLENGIDLASDGLSSDESILTAQNLLDYPISKTLHYMTTHEEEEEDY